MWYDELGPVLEPLVRKLANSLQATCLGVWILRSDGRHFLEDPPPLRSPNLHSIMGLRRPAGSTAPPSGSSTLESDCSVEIVDPEGPPHRVLVFECQYPDLFTLPIGYLRPLAPESFLYAFLDSDQPVCSRLLDQHPVIPELPSQSGEERWMCRLENQGLLLGLVGLTRPASTCDDFPNLFASVWEHQKNQWEQLQLETALARRTEILEVIQAVGNTITSQLEIHDILQSVVEQATILMKAKTASLMLVNRETNELVLESVYGSSPDYIRKPNLDISTSLIGRVIRSGKPLMVRDVRECSAYQHRELAGSEGLVSLLSVPLKWRDTCMGALNVYSARRYRYTRDNVDLLSLLASQSAIAIQNAQTLSQAKRLEAQVHDLDKRSLVGELAAGVAHEIRNPLTVVTMLIDAWEAHDANEAEDLQVISTQLKGINRCVTQLLEIAKPRPLEMSWVNLEHEIAASLQVLRIRFEDQGVALQLSLAPNLPVVHVDSARFHQLLMNLCLNALNAMLQGGKISLSTAQTTPAAFECLPGTTIVPWKGWGVSLPSLCGERLGASPHPPSFPLSTAERESRGELFVLLSLADAGGGIQVNREEHSTLTAYQCDLKEIFEPFRSQTPGGFGLGLSVVKRIVEEHQAGLKVYNQPGKGLTFFLLLEGGVVALTH